MFLQDNVILVSPKCLSLPASGLKSDFLLEIWKLDGKIIQWS